MVFIVRQTGVLAYFPLATSILQKTKCWCVEIHPIFSIPCNIQTLFYWKWRVSCISATIKRFKNKPCEWKGLLILQSWVLKYSTLANFPTKLKLISLVQPPKLCFTCYTRLGQMVEVLFLPWLSACKEIILSMIIVTCPSKFPTSTIIVTDQE